MKTQTKETEGGFAYRFLQWTSGYRLLVIVVVLWLLFWVGMYCCFYANGSGTEEAGNWGNAGTTGDMFGSLNTLFSGLALAAILITIQLQRKEMENQRTISGQELLDNTFIEYYRLMQAALPDSDEWQQQILAVCNREELDSEKTERLKDMLEDGCANHACKYVHKLISLLSEDSPNVIEVCAVLRCACILIGKYLDSQQVMGAWFRKVDSTSLLDSDEKNRYKHLLWDLVRLQEKSLIYFDAAMFHKLASNIDKLWNDMETLFAGSEVMQDLFLGFEGRIWDDDERGSRAHQAVTSCKAYRRMIALLPYMENVTLKQIDTVLKTIR